MLRLGQSPVGDGDLDPGWEGMWKGLLVRAHLKQLGLQGKVIKLRVSYFPF